MKKIYPPVMVLYAFLSVFFSFLEIEPAIMVFGENYIVYRTAEARWFLFSSHSLIMLNLLVLIFIFLAQGLRSEERFVRTRCFLLSGGITLMTLGLALNILFWGLIIYGLILPLIIAIGGGLLILRAVLMREEISN